MNLVIIRWIISVGVAKNPSVQFPITPVERRWYIGLLNAADFQAMMEMLQAQFSEVKTEPTKKEQLLINVSTDNKEMMPVGMCPRATHNAYNITRS
jgi:hypothetical protein